MRPHHVLAPLTAALCTTVCSAPRRPIALTASPADHEALPGSWTGTHTIDRLRGGMIDFTLQEDSGEAFVDVLMIPRGADRACGPFSPEAGYRGRGPDVVPEVLTLRFARAEDGRLAGALTPTGIPIGGARPRRSFLASLPAARCRVRSFRSAMSALRPIPAVGRCGVAGREVDHTVRSASIGSRRAARRAGTAAMPMRTLTAWACSGGLWSARGSQLGERESTQSTCRRACQPPVRRARRVTWQRSGSTS